MRQVAAVCQTVAKEQDVQAKFFSSWIRERVAIKRAITGGGVPSELVNDFKNLWKESLEFINE